MPEALVRLAAALLVLTFAWAATAKAVRFSSWRDALMRYSLPPGLRTAAGAGVPLAETGVVALLVTGATKAGAALAVALLASFSLVLLAGHAGGERKAPCGCFGRATERDYRLLLLRNALLGAVAAVVLAGPASVRVTEGWAFPAATDAVPALLVALGIALVALVARQAEQAARRGRR